MIDQLRADLLFRGGPIFDRPDDDALAVAGGRILAVGRRDDLAGLVGPRTRIVELAGRPLLPGFVDAHLHLAAFALGRRQLDLEGMVGLEAVAERVAAGAARLPPGAWVFGHGWLRDRLERWPTATDLERVSPDHPVALSSHDHHALWVNGEALRRAGLSRKTLDPPGGRLGRLADGAPSGLLFEAAQGLIWDAVPEPPLEERIAALAEAVAVANQAGLAGVHDFEGATALEALRALRDRGRLTLRVTMGPTVEALEEGWGGLYGGDDWLRVELVKLYADGALGSRTAFMLQPYEGTSERGIARLRRDELVDLVRRARARGLGVATHAIGDAAVRLVLDAYEVARADATPAAPNQVLRIEHAQLVDPADLPRFARLRVVASMQPNHAPSDRPVAEAHWGGRCAHAYPWRALLASGATLALGTDCPVESLDPLRNLHAVVTRQDLPGEPPGGWYPEQCLTLEEAVRAYTLGSAHAAGQADSRGSLEAGKLADLVVLSERIDQRPEATLQSARVDLTVVGGRMVFERE